VEHIVSEALGNVTLILPPGVVCDRCNHGTLSRLDEPGVERLSWCFAGIATP